MSYDDGTKTFTVATSDELNAAIANIDAIGKGDNNNGLAAGAYTIRLAADIMLGQTAPAATYAAQNKDGTAGAALTIDSGTGGPKTTVAGSAQLYALNLSNGTTVTIDGGGHTLDGAKTYNGFFVYDGTVGIQDLTIADMAARGGNGGNSHSGGGGGGAGLGGGLFVAGTGNVDGSGNALATGGIVTLTNVGFKGDSATGGAGGAESIPNGSSSGGGGLDGGNGDYFGGGGVGLTANASRVLGAGGGIILGAAAGGTASKFIFKKTIPGGAFGGAGGGGGVGGRGSDNPFSGGFGGGGSLGADGGFGGGGGVAGYSGGGGFGGGGGGYGPDKSTAGFGAGAGGYHYGGGGGGLGAGADVFVQQGGVLHIGGAGTLGAGTVAGGAGGGGYGARRDGTAGRGLGTALFLQGDQGATLLPAVGATLAVAGDIADQSGDGGTGATAGAGGLTVGDGAPAGIVVLAAANSYTGATAVQSGTLLVDGSTSAASKVTVAGGATLGGDGAMSGTVDLSGALSASAAGYGTAGAPATAGGPATPGAGPSYGTLTTGALTFEAGASLVEEIGGTAAGSYDTVAVQGTARLGGTLTLSSVTGSAYGANYAVLTATGGLAAGTAFTDAADGATIQAGGRSFRVAYAAGGNGTAGSVTLTDITTTPGAPTITTPAEGADTNSRTVAGTGTAGDTIALTIDGAAFATAQPIVVGQDGHWSTTAAGLADGPHSAIATQAAAGEGPSAASAPDTFTLDATPPTITSIAIADTGRTENGVDYLGAGQVMTFTATTSEPVSISGGTPTLTLDDGAVASYDAGASTPTDLVFDYTVGAGQNTQRLAVTGVDAGGARVTDRAGNALDTDLTHTAEPSRTIVVDTAAPAVAFASPGSTTTSADQTITGTVKDANPGGTVFLFDNGADTAFATAVLDGNGAFAMTVTLVQGANSITARDADLAGNVGTSAPVTYTLVNPPPPSGGTDPSTSPTDGPDRLTVASGGSVAGLGGDDTIAGAGSNVLLGNQGDDVIAAGTGPNTVFGGMGDDLISAGDGGDLIYGGEGSDSITAGNGDNTVVGGTGNGSSDSLDGADFIRTGSGDDFILGNGGNDTVGAGAGSDTVLGGYGNDIILGNQGDDIILGNQGDNTLFGGMGNDTLVGGQGNDVLIGGEGDDVLYGNEGLNTFVFNPGDTDFKSGVSTGDVIMDFATGTSRIDFASGPVGTAMDFGSTTTTAKDFASAQMLAQTLIDGGDTYAFVANGTDGYLFTTGGRGTAIQDAVKLAGAGTATSLKYADIADGALA